MQHISSLDEGLEIFKALSSEVRIQIIKILIKHPDVNLNELANKLHITNGAITNHIKKLESAGIITAVSDKGGHGNDKLYAVTMDKLLVDISEIKIPDNVYNASIKVGHFTDYEVFPTCGIATSKALIGEVDDSRYFSHTDRYDADILWFTKGYVDYDLPNFIPNNQKITQLLISAELSSEAPGINNDWPSDINFYLNDVFLGSWTSPGDFGDVPGIFTPDWWFPNWNQYGLLKMIVINEDGTYIDGLKISEVNIRQFDLDSKSKLKFRIAVDERSKNVGGVTIFGSNFGNYNQDINVSIHYMPKDKE